MYEPMDENVPLNLLDESFPGIKANIARCEKAGFPWPSKPFVKEVEQEAVSHVGFLDYPLHIEGKKHSSAALHAICTKASCRGQGFASELIQAALDFAKDRYECLLLFTDIPKFYEKLSFRTIQEHRFHLSCQCPKGVEPLFPLTSPHDDALFIRCFLERAAASSHFWVEERGQIASFNALFATYPAYWSLYFSPAFDGILSFEIKDKTLHLFDIIAKKIPSLEIILAHLPSAIEEIYFYFSPDLVTNSAACKPLICDNTIADFNVYYLMVHGDFPEVSPFMISPISRC